MNLLALAPAELDEVLNGVEGWSALRGQRLLLTGGTGFVGKWLLASFLHANRARDLQARVVLLSRDVAAFRAQYPELAEAPEIEWLQGDVREFSLAPEQSCNFAIHAATDVAASQTPTQIFDTCVRGTARVLTQMPSGRLLQVSSGAVYGAMPGTMERVPEDWTGAPDCLRPGSAYGEGKRAAELLCAMAAAERPALAVPIARCFAFVGPHLPLDKHFAIGNFIRDAMAGQPLRIAGDGRPLRSYLYAGDLARWLWTLLFRGESARAYNVGGDELLSIAQLAQRVVGALGSRSSIDIAQAPRPGALPSRYVPELHRAAAEFGLQARVGLDEAIRRTAQWAEAAQRP